MLGFRQRFGGSSCGENQIGIVVMDYFVDLPKVDRSVCKRRRDSSSCLQSYIFATAMGAYLGHDERLVAFSL